VVKEPFYQLFSIHSFLKSDDCVKQVPLCYVFMTGKRKRHYKKVLSAVIEILPAHLQVEKVVLEIESAMWKALEAVLPNVKHQGCSFHWTQAVWRKLQEIGLQKAYTDNDDVHKFCKRVMALPFLPANEISGMYLRLWGKTTDAKLIQLMDYVNNQWIE
jgi:hypothetical protein